MFQVGDIVRVLPAAKEAMTPNGYKHNQDAEGYLYPIWIPSIMDFIIQDNPEGRIIKIPVDPGDFCDYAHILFTDKDAEHIKNHLLIPLEFLQHVQTTFIQSTRHRI